MLRIKEFHKDGTKIELKELEKFGFKEYTKNSYAFNNNDRDIAEILIEQCEYVDDNFYIIINPYGNNEAIKSKLLDILFDLIKADLVEKVEE